jgi:hypothetical protein
MYLYVKDTATAYQNWVKKGAWTIAYPTLSVSVNPKSWDIGQMDVSKTITMSASSKITVINDGTNPETFTLALINPPGWTAADTPGRETYVINGLFCQTSVVPSENSFNTDTVSSEDTILTTPKTASKTVFGYNNSSINGSSVPKGEGRALYLQFKSPTTTDKTSEQNISVIVSAQTP